MHGKLHRTMYGGLNKEGGGIVGEGLLTRDATGQFVDLSDAAANASAEESLVCLQQTNNVDTEEWKEMVVTSFIDVESGEVSWRQAEDADAVYRRTICMSQMSSMLNDSDRNNVYERAIQICIAAFMERYNRAPIILDIGAGTGLLSMLAARHGAQQVIGCEMFGHMAAIASEVVVENEMDDRVQIVAAKSSDIDTESFTADILISELLDTALLGEGCIPSHTDAIQRGLLASQIVEDDSMENIKNRVIPNSAEVFACLIESKDVDSMKNVGSIDFSGLDIIGMGKSSASSSSAFSTFRDESAEKCEGNRGTIPIQWKEYFDRGTSKVLTETASILDVNFYCDPEEMENKIHAKMTTLGVKVGGKANAVLFWWKVYLLSPDLDPTRSLYYSTEPGVQCWQDHWVQCLYPLPSPVQCIEGKDIQLVCRRDSLQIWFEAKELPSGVIASKKRSINGEQFSEGDDSTCFPSPCSCGWHLLCDADRLSALNDLDRMSKFRSAIEYAVHRMRDIDLGTLEEVSIADKKSGEFRSPMVISLDISDGSSLAFTLASTFKSYISSDTDNNKFNDQFRIVSMERKQFSRILSMQLASANGLDDFLAIWDGNDMSQIPYLFSDENDEVDGDSDKQLDCYNQNVKIGMLLCEDHFYQLRALPVAQAISFLYMRRSLNQRLLPNAPIIPQRAKVMVAAIELPDLSTSNRLLGKVCGFNHSSFDSIRKDWHMHTFPYKMSQYRKKFLTPPSEVHIFEYQHYNGVDDDICTSIHIPFNASGRGDAVVIWVDYELSPGINLSSLDSKENKNDFKEYLKSGVRFFEQPVNVTSSSSLEVEVSFNIGDSDVNLKFTVK